MTASTSIRPTGAVAGNWQGVAVLLPCRDEAQTVAGVVDAFSTTLPRATVYVYDNGSTDRTAELAAAAGAVVRRETCDAAYMPTHTAPATAWGTDCSTVCTGRSSDPGSATSSPGTGRCPEDS